MYKYVCTYYIHVYVCVCVCVRVLTLKLGDESHYHFDSSILLLGAGSTQKQVTDHHGFWRPMEPKAAAKASGTKAHAETVRETWLLFWGLFFWGEGQALIPKSPALL